MSASPHALYRRLLIVLTIGFAAAALFVLSGQTLGVYETQAAVSGMLLIAVTNAAVLAGLLMQAERHHLKLDIAGGISLSKALLVVLGLGLLVGFVFAQSGTQLGVFDLEASVTGLGVATVVLTIVLALLLWTLRGAGFFVTATVGARELVHLVPDEEAEHILIIEGIGPKYASRLNAHGIITIPQLREADPQVLAKAGRCTLEFAQEWQAMARFMDVKGIGPQFAEVLARVGLRQVEELAQSDGADLASRIMALEASRKTRIQGTEVTAAVAERWIMAARDYTGFTRN